jgi:hypothetical protein
MPRFIPKSVKQRKPPVNGTVIMPAAPVARITRPDRCENCKFHGISPDGGSLDCRIRPPRSQFVPAPGGQISQLTHFPRVNIDWWCGEWKQGLVNGG